MPAYRRAPDSAATADSVSDISEHFRMHSGPLARRAPTLRMSKGPKGGRVLRYALLACVLSAGWILPASAQMSDADALRAGRSVLDAWNRTAIAKDVSGHAALYAEDVVQVTPFGIIAGRPALIKNLQEGVTTYTANPSTLERVVMLGPSVMLRFGTWSGTTVMPNGSVPVRGYWSDVDVRDGDGWQIRQESWNVTPPPPPQQAK